MTKNDLKNAIIDTEDEWIEEALPAGMGRTKKRRAAMAIMSGVMKTGET